MATAWQMDGMDSPCWVEVGESRAPVGQKRMFCHFPSRIPLSRYPVSTVAEHPQPEPPQWTSCFFRSKIITPQSS